MKITIVGIAISCCLILASLRVAAQSPIKPLDRVTPALPRNLYIDNYLATHPSFAGQTKKVGSTALFDFYKLPPDNMICAVPTKTITGHIRVYDPTLQREYISVEIPNVLLRTGL